MKENSLRKGLVSPKEEEYSLLLAGEQTSVGWKGMEMRIFAEQLTILDTVLFHHIQPKDVILYAENERSESIR